MCSIIYKWDFVPAKSNISAVDKSSKLSVLKSISYCAYCNSNSGIKINVSYCFSSSNIRLIAKCHGEVCYKEIDSLVWPFDRSKSSDELLVNLESLVNLGVFTFFGNCVIVNEEESELNKILDNMDGF